jgi:hypothetical protein
MTLRPLFHFGNSAVKFTRDIALVAVCLCALLFASCSSLQPVSAEKMVRGLHADHVTVIVPKAVIGRHQDLRLDMPAANCTSFASNDKGVFFKADKQVSIRSWVVLIPKFVDGGVFVPDDPALPCKPFYVAEGTPFAVEKTQEPVSVTLVDALTNKRITLRME